MFYITYLFIVVIVRFLAIKIAGVNAGKFPLAVCDISPVVIYGRHSIRPPPLYLMELFTASATMSM